MDNNQSNQNSKSQKPKKRFARDIAKVTPQKVVHPSTFEAKILMTHKDRLNFILDVARGRGINLKGTISAENRKFLRSIARTVFGGTQEPVIRVASDFTTLTTGAGGTLATATSYYWGGAIDNANWALVFDEVKVLSGMFEIWPAANPAVAAICVFVIDYDNNTVLASNAAALAYDTRYVIEGNDPGQRRPRDHGKIFVIPQGIPDKQWIDTTDTSTVSAYLKTFSDTAAMSTQLFRVFFEMEVKFRQVD